MVKVHKPLYQRWRRLTDSLGFGERGMMKLLDTLLGHAEANPTQFRKEEE